MWTHDVKFKMNGHSHELIEFRRKLTGIKDNFIIQPSNIDMLYIINVFKLDIYKHVLVWKLLQIVKSFQYNS